MKISSFRILFSIILLVAGTVMFPISTLAQASPTFKQIESVTDLYQFFDPSIQDQILVSAHRGGPTTSYPENCLATFNHTLSQVPALIEFDVEITQDSVLILMHDDSLHRTTNGMGAVHQMAWKDMRSLLLKDHKGIVSDYRIPTFSEAIHWGKQKTIMFVDVKRQTPFHMVIDTIKKYHAEPFCVLITYSLEDAVNVHQLHPDIMISLSVRDITEWEKVKQTEIPLNRIIAFTGTDKAPNKLYKSLHKEQIMVNLGTMWKYDPKFDQKGGKSYKRLARKGVDIFATDLPVDVWRAVNE